MLLLTAVLPSEPTPEAIDWESENTAGARIDGLPPEAILVPGDLVQLALVIDSAQTWGETTWRSELPSVADVSADGRLVATGPGPFTVRAESPGFHATLHGFVAEVPVVPVSQPSLALLLGLGDGPGAGTELGTPIVLGALDVSVVQAGVRRGIRRLERCYSKSPSSRTPGTITEKFVIAADGSVATATTKRTTFADSKLEHCVNAVFRNLTFGAPRSRGIVIVSYPLEFSP